jgi:hypothetical protein
VYELFTSRRSFCALEKTVGKMAPSLDGCFIVLSGYKVWEETGRLTLCKSRRRNGLKRPVLKHGPRSLTTMRVFEW